MTKRNKITVSFLPSEKDLWQFIQSKKATCNISENVRTLIRKDMEFSSVPKDEEIILQKILQKLEEKINITSYERHLIDDTLLNNEVKDTINNLWNGISTLNCTYFLKQIREAYKINHTLVKVNRSNMITYKSNQYSVPAGYIGKTVSLQVYDNHIHVYYSTELIVQHEIQQRKLNYKQEHYIETLSKQLPYTNEIEELALKNLEAINEVYDNEQ